MRLRDDGFDILALRRREVAVAVLELRSMLSVSPPETIAGKPLFGGFAMSQADDGTTR